MVPGLGTLQASLSSRLPPWGRGVFEAATYFVSLNMAGFARPFLALQRPVIPGQELSGFAISPALSPGGMLMHYGRTHVAHRIHDVRGRRGPVFPALDEAIPVKANRMLVANRTFSTDGSEDRAM